jgi:hypothetical protein
MLVMPSATTWGAWRRSQLRKLSACCCSLQNTTFRPFTLRARPRHALHTGPSQQVPGVSGGQLSHRSWKMWSWAEAGSDSNGTVLVRAGVGMALVYCSNLAGTPACVTLACEAV